MFVTELNYIEAFIYALRSYLSSWVHFKVRDRT